MVSPVLNERYYPGAFIISEANGLRSRDTALVKNPGGTDLVLEAGLVMATLTTDGSLVPYDNVGTDGSEVASCILYGGGVIPAGGQKRLAVVARDAEVNAAELRYDASVDATGRAAALVDLATRGIIGR